MSWLTAGSKVDMLQKEKRERKEEREIKNIVVKELGKEEWIECAKKKTEKIKKVERENN